MGKSMHKRMEVALMEREMAFLQAMVLNPEDTALPLVFADWLEEHGRWTHYTQEQPHLCGHHFPHWHRVCDIRLRETPFRVTRCVLCRGSLRMHRIAEQLWSPRPGVPLGLNGTALQRWIKDELSGESTEDECLW